MILRLALLFIFGTATAGVAAPISVDRLQSSAPEMIHRIHDCHANTKFGIAGFHHHEGQNCERITDPDPKSWRDKRGRLCQRYCFGAIPYIECKVKCTATPRPR